MQQGQIEADELSKALQDVSFSFSNSSNDQQLARSCTAHPQTSPAPAGRRSRGPSLSMRRRTSFDERRIPPTLSEDHQIYESTTALVSATPGAALPTTRSRSSSIVDGAHTRRASRQLLRRISTDTAFSLDFDSDPESFSPARATGRPPSIASAWSRRSSLIGGIHVRDNSDNEVTTFTKEVRIPAFHTVGKSFGGFIAYECQIMTRESATLQRMKRYSDFCQLRDELLAAFPNYHSIVDSLPPKSLAKFRVSFLEKRRKRLAFWLSTVLLHPVLGGSTQAKAWILD